MKILVLGTGLMGGAIIYDLINFGQGHHIGIADRNNESLENVLRNFDSKFNVHQIDCANESEVNKVFKDYDLVISAVPYRFNYTLSEIAIKTKTHFLDLGGNNEIVRRQLSLNEPAEKNDVLILPNCGLAPGLSNILAMLGFRQFESVEKIYGRVGGLPQNPRPPFFYQLVFSPEGLINEYLEKAEIIQNGKRIHVESMTGLEELTFDRFDTDQPLEAFYTSGGLSLLPELLDGKVKDLNYKTIRYRGHCERFKILLDSGFASSEPVMIGDTIHTSRELFEELLRKKLTGFDEDVVLFRVEIYGIINGKSNILTYEMVDYFDRETKMTAMMRTTAYPTTVTALMISNGDIKKRGACLPEEVVDGGVMINDLRKRSIVVTEQWQKQ